MILLKSQPSLYTRTLCKNLSLLCPRFLFLLFLLDIFSLVWIRLNTQQYWFKCFLFFFPVYPILTHTSPRFRSFIILGRENHHPSHPSNYFTSFYTQFYVYVLTFIIICVLQFLNTDTSLSWTILLFHNWIDFKQFLPPYLDRSWRFFCLSL